MGVTANGLRYPDLTPDAPNIPIDMQELAEDLDGAPVLHSTGVAAAIGATPILPGTVTPYVGLTVVNINTAAPSAWREWRCVDTSPVTWQLVRSSNRVGCTARGTANVSATNGSVTAAALAAERYDSDSFHDTATNNSRITIPAGLDGEYDVTAHARCGATPLGTNNFYGIRRNGTVMLVRTALPAGNFFASGNPSRRVVLAAGDYIELVVQQNTGGTVSTAIETQAENGNDPDSPLLEVTWVGPA